ncbi:MAG: hypothetical protein J6U02_00970 [Elusimicrobia bacterium]|nr:hypothetical protein [Elusimicrobiota bacterium]
MSVEKFREKTTNFDKFFSANMFEDFSVTLGSQEKSSWSTALNFSNEWLFCLEMRNFKRTTQSVKL